MNEPPPQLLDLGYAQVAVREWGDPAARPVFFWHALGDHNNLQLIEAAPILASEYGLRIVAIDAPGFGASPPADDSAYEVPALVDLAAAVLDELGFDRVAWMGSSWGASIGVHFAATYPHRVAALVLLDGGYRDLPAENRSLDEEKAHWRGRLDLFRFDSWEAMVDSAKGFFRRWNPALETMNRASYREVNGAVISIMGPDVYGAASYGIRQAPPSSAHERLGASGVPVLLLAATLPEDTHAEREAAADRFAQLVPQAEVRWLDDTPHFVLEDKPEETTAAVGSWLHSLAYS